MRADLSDGEGVFLVKSKFWFYGDGALYKQRDRRVLRQRFERRHGSRIRQRKRSHWEFMFSVHVQSCATGDQNFEMRTHRQEFCQDWCSGH